MARTSGQLALPFSVKDPKVRRANVCGAADGTGWLRSGSADQTHGRGKRTGDTPHDITSRVGEAGATGKPGGILDVRSRDPTRQAGGAAARRSRSDPQARVLHVRTLAYERQSLSIGRPSGRR